MRHKGLLYQFARLFWPKEMKELVARYEAKGTLNEEAVQYFNNRTLMLITILTIILLFFINSSLLTGSLIILSGLLFHKWELNVISERAYKPYLNGN